MKPVVTFVIYAFNEEKFVDEAIESAFAQTYSPLEIVLSDDGSTDRTYQIMEGMAASYKGPHRIILNRNERNIGIGSQLNAAWQASKGELFVLANADDVSGPERVARTVEVWISGDPRPMAVTTDLQTMDAEGSPLVRVIRPRVVYDTLPQAIAGRCGPVLAASLALDRAVFDRFGLLLPSLIIEDGPLFLRAMLLGPTRHVEECLVRYRIHKENISQAYAGDNFESWIQRYRQKNAWQRREGTKAYLQMLVDLSSSQAGTVAPADLERAKWAATEKLMEYQTLAGYYEGADAVTLTGRAKTLGRLGSLVTKVAIKRLFPFIERRNDRWHYRRVLEADQDHR